MLGDRLNLAIDTEDSGAEAQEWEPHGQGGLFLIQVSSSRTV